MALHTPGPWRVSRGKACGGGEYLTVTAPPIAPTMPPRAKFFEMPYGNTASETDIANANLVAAAPDLLEALEAMRGIKLGGEIPWKHNAAITNDIEALRDICLAFCEVWNTKALPAIMKAKGLPRGSQQ